MSGSPVPVSAVAGWPTAFRGSAAIAAGLVTRDRLRGPSFLRLFPDVYAAVPEKPPPDLGLRSRTAFDLARRPGLDLTEAVVAVDALANQARFNPDLLLNFRIHYPRARGNAQVATVLTYADAKAGSPMATRLRMTIVLAGLPAPHVQYVVQDEAARTAIWLDLAYPRQRIGIEYEGADHTRPDQVLRDAGRYTRLVDRGWRIYRYTKYDIHHDRPRIIAELTRALTGEKTRVR